MVNFFSVGDGGVGGGNDLDFLVIEDAEGLGGGVGGKDRFDPEIDFEVFFGECDRRVGFGLLFFFEVNFPQER